MILEDIDWYCDSCNAYLNAQEGFDDSAGLWECQECGYLNDVTADNILYDDLDNAEAISVYDAALIWLSSGRNEDYMFGYSEEELKKAL